MANTYSNLTYEQIELLKNMIKNEDAVFTNRFKKLLGLPFDYTFGYEIEASGCYIDQIKEKFEKEVIPKLNQKDYLIHTDGSLWIDITDPGDYGPTREWDEQGAEISTPILKDLPEVWRDLEIICDFLKNNAKVEDNCSIHTNIGANVLGKNYKNWYNFLKVFAAIEPEIYKYMARGKKIRPCAISGFYRYQYAMPIHKKIVKGLNKTPEDNTDIDYLLTQCELNARDCCDEPRKYNSISFVNLYKQIESGKRAVSFYYDGLDKTEKDNRIEFRMANGTFEVNEIQGDLFVCNQIIQRAKSLTQEQEVIIDKLLEMDFPKNYNDVMINRAIMVSNFLFDDNKDKMIFLLTYLSDNEKRKIIELTGEKDFIDVE